MSALGEFNQAFGFRFHEPLRADQVAVLVEHARARGKHELAARLEAELLTGANGGNEGGNIFHELWEVTADTKDYMLNHGFQLLATYLNRDEFEYERTRGLKLSSEHWVRATTGDKFRVWSMAERTDGVETADCGHQPSSVASVSSCSMSAAEHNAYPKGRWG